MNNDASDNAIRMRFLQRRLSCTVIFGVLLSWIFIYYTTLSNSSKHFNEYSNFTDARIRTLEKELLQVCFLVGSSDSRLHYDANTDACGSVNFCSFITVGTLNKNLLCCICERKKH